jgi:hypothetical protein
MIGIVPVINGIIDLIRKNIIAKTNVTANVLTGDILVEVENSFHFNNGEEIILIDSGYNNKMSPHYKKYEYCQINRIINTHYIELSSPIIDDSGWLVDDYAFIQKTIGHSPIYDDRVYYGDRNVIPTEEMAIAVEPLSLSNEWMYLHGGLSEEYKISIMIYGKDIETEQGMQILNLYTNSVYNLLNKSIHIDVDNYTSPLLSNVSAGSNTVIVEDSLKNRINFIPSSKLKNTNVYEVQDNIGIEVDLFATNVSSIIYDGVPALSIELSQGNPITNGQKSLNRSYNLDEYAILSKHGRYFWDARIDDVEYGVVQKGSAFLRASKLSWFGKEITDHKFPQKTLRTDYFSQVNYV